MKKIITLMITVALILSSALSTTVSAAQSGVCGDNLTYTLDDNGLLTITGTGVMYDDVWCFNYDGIKKVVVEQGATTIGNFEFMLNETIEEVILPEGLTQIGDSAFHTTNIKRIVIPKSVTDIGRLAFFQCFQLTDIYYGGTAEDWNKINIGENNDMWLTTDKIHYETREIATNNTSDIETEIKTDAISVQLDGVDLVFDQPPIIENGRTLVPFRAIFEALGTIVGWNDTTKTVTAENANTKITLTIDSDKMYVGGTVKILDVPAKIVNNRTMVPARAVAEALGAKVDWDAALNRVIISTK